jgi:hypothetical protein
VTNLVKTLVKNLGINLVKNLGINLGINLENLGISQENPENLETNLGIIKNHYLGWVRKL